MTKHVAWLGAAALMVSLCMGARIAHAQASEPLKPYVVLVLDTSLSMDDATSSGPPSCGGEDTKLDHARCAINNIVNAYGDMVFGLARFRMSMSGTTTANTFPSGCNTSQAECNADDDRFELLTALVDGNNEQAAAWTNFTGNTCTASGSDPEIWAPAGFTPIAGSLKGAKRYWSGQQASDGTTIWSSASAGFSPIINDTSRNQSFLPKPGKPATCSSVRVANGGTPACDDSAGCSHPTNCCCAEQCRPYLTIMLTDGDETCGDFDDDTVPATSSLLATDLVVGGHTRRYRVETKPIGFGKAPGDGEIEAMAHAGGAVNVPGVNEGYYASDEAGLQLAISQILDDAIRTEECNLQDDDCDTFIDEGYATGASCNNGRLGKCRVNGTTGCRQDGTNVECSAGIGPTPAGPGNVPPACPACGCVSKALGAACTVVNSSNAIVTGTCQAGNPQLVCVPTAATGPNPTDPADNEIPTGCNNIDDDCDGFIDEGVTGCTCTPQAELCNGLNDDCDGATDENLTINCNNGTCFGQRVCNPNKMNGGVPCNRNQTNPNAPDSCWEACTADVPDPLGEHICDGLDDNCDGNADGFQEACSNMFCPGGTCTAGRCVGGAQAGEPCGTFPAFDPRNNPGHADSNLPMPNCFSLGAACICHPGNRVCLLNGGGTYGDCLGEVEPRVEVCNDLDDDCDGKIDEAPPLACTQDSDCPPITPDCAPDPGGGPGMTCQYADCSVGMCGGELQCVGGVQECTQSIGVDDTCNGVNEDCDANTDEHWQCTDPDGPDNIPGNADDCPCDDANQCNEREQCQNGSIVCIGDPVGVEICDCNDNNCNGEVDEGNLCGAGADCIDCQCAFKCSEGEFPCPIGRICNAQNYCVTDPCFGFTCPAVAGDVQVCRPDPNNPTMRQCISACDPSYQTCNSGFVCVPEVGECRPDDCRTFPDRCTQNESCINGVCVGNPCAGVTCDAGQYCNNGNCYSSCAGVTCAQGQRCVLGQCEDSPCDRACPFGQACHEASGECRPDVCGSFECPLGQWCNPELGGGCVDDPCALYDIQCADGEVCRNGTCYDAEAFLPDGGVETHVTTGGGGGCSTSNGSGSGTLVLGLGIVLGLSLRRRRQLKIALNAAGIAVLAASSFMISCNVNEYCLNCATGDGGGDDDGGPGDDGGGGDDGGPDDGGPGDGGCSLVLGPEECDGEDNDCDGQVDENPSTLPTIGDLCENQLGECAGGVKQCSGGQIVCSKPAMPEICDNLDNNCNGMFDEGDPGGGAACGTNTGECQAGVNRCVNGQIVCQGAIGPVAEQCNNRDDDCDTRFDEDVNLGPCVAGVDGPQQGNEGVCELGMRQCVGGAPRCVGAVFPTFELCDAAGLDQDCNGQPSNGYNTMTDPNNCGACENVCDLDNAIPACVNGTCAIAACAPNFFDNDTNPMNGCEFNCGHPSFGAEICNGIDDDCDGLIDGADDDMVIPGNNCDTDGACSVGTMFTCDGAAGWRCHYTGANVSIQTMPTVDNTIIVPETRCDSDLFTGPNAQLADNDCDVRIDEAQANLGAVCDNGMQGVCRSTGTFQCDSMPAADRFGPAVCVFTQMGTAPGTETCDGLDNNCNGVVDDGALTGNMGNANGQAWSDIPGTNPVRQIMTYEASRPDARQAVGGELQTHVCSRAGVLPWTNITYPQAVAACAAIGAEICSEAEWQNDCEPDISFPVAGPPNNNVTTFAFMEAEDGQVTNQGPASRAWTKTSPIGYNGITAMTTQDIGFVQTSAANAMTQSSRISFPMTLLASTAYRVFLRVRAPLVDPVRSSTAAVSGETATSAADTQVGDLVIVATLSTITNGNSFTHTTQSGYTDIATQFLNDGSNDARLSIAYRVVPAGEAGARSYRAFSTSVTNDLTGLVVLRAGTYDVSNILSAGVSFTSGNDSNNGEDTTNVTVPSYGFSFAGWHTGSANQTVSAPGGWTELWETPGTATGELAAAVQNTIVPVGDDANPGNWGDNHSQNGSLNITVAIGAARSHSAHVGISAGGAGAPTTVVTATNDNVWHWVMSPQITTGAGTSHTLSVFLYEDGLEIDTIAVARHTSQPTFDNSWSFATNPRTYVGTTCNGDDLDTGAAAGDQDDILPTGPNGARNQCYSEHGAHDTWDLSGNVKEWTQARAPGQNPIRGGASNNEGPGMTCKSNFTLADDDFFFPNVGFRCCRNRP